VLNPEFRSRIPGRVVQDDEENRYEENLNLTAARSMGNSTKITKYADDGTRSTDKNKVPSILSRVNARSGYTDLKISFLPIAVVSGSNLQLQASFSDLLEKGDGIL
jgi:hypothetical protein